MIRSAKSNHDNGRDDTLLTWKRSLLSLRGCVGGWMEWHDTNFIGISKYNFVSNSRFVDIFTVLPYSSRRRFGRNFFV